MRTREYQPVGPGSSPGLVEKWTVTNLLRTMERSAVKRAFIIYRDGRFILSHPAILGSIQEFLETSNDFDEHEGIFIGREDGIETLFFAFVHSTKRGLAQGGLRFLKYDNIGSLLTDGLRLSRGMTRKN